MKPKPDNASLERSLRKIQQEGQGVWRFEVFDSTDLPEFMLKAALFGPPTAGVHKAVFDVAMRVARTGQAPDCLLCGSVLGLGNLPRDIMVLVAMVDTPREGVGCCICAACHDDDHEVLSGKITAYVKANLISDLRRLPPMAPGGTG